jgi:hypothetical protein
LGDPASDDRDTQTFQETGRANAEVDAVGIASSGQAFGRFTFSFVWTSVMRPLRVQVGSARTGREAVRTTTGADDMTISENLTTFYGRDVIDYDPDNGLAGGIAPRLRLDAGGDSDGTFSDLYMRFLEEPAVSGIEALVIGIWNPMQEGDPAERVVENLVSTRDRLARLKALFLGDIISEENEISWIEQTDVSPLFTAFPQLEVFGVRGGNGLSLGRPSHPKLKTLIVETGGLSRRVVHEVCAADLPALEHLELWLGTGEYGGDATADDLAPILSGRLFPRLNTLALRDCEWADDLAVGLAGAPILARLKMLDLSLGNLGDRGALALAAAPVAAGLERIDIHHHYVSEEVVAKLTALGPRINAEQRMKPDSWRGEEHRYIAVSE